MCVIEARPSLRVSLGPEPTAAPTAEPLVCPPPPQAGTDLPVLAEDAQQAFAAAARLAGEGKPRRALLHLEVAERAHPDLADRLALREGELLLASGQAREACRAFGRAEDSPDGNVRARARVGRVRCLIAAGDDHAGRELAALLRSYPELPIALELRFELARAQETAGNKHTAARLYRNLDALDPATGVAERARARLAALAREGVHVPALPAEQQVDRLERLAGSAPPSEVQEAIATLDSTRLSDDLRCRVALVQARIARHEGRWGDARRYLEKARWTGELPEDVDPKTVASRAHDMADAVAARDPDRADRMIHKLKGWRPYARLPVARLLAILDYAVPAGRTEVVDGVLEALDSHDDAATHVFDAATRSIGTGSDEVVATVLSHLVSDPRVGLAARYHYARMLERLGRWAEAELELIRVRRDDASSLGWYRMWADLRLREVRTEMVGRCGPDDVGLAMSAAAYAPGAEELGASCTAPLPESATAEPATGASMEGMRPSGHALASPVGPATVDTNALAARLRPVAESFGEAYPWLPRAVDLLSLGDAAEAADELHEAYLAWRSAIGRPIRRAGLLAVYLGGDLPRPRATWSTLQERRDLDGDSRAVLADVAMALNDPGTAVGFDASNRAGTRPRAYRKLVVEAARRHGLDPNLLFAVMRVESVYQHRIVSYAGAVGLMQIMPRTGRLIARELERHDFTVDQLLDPATNLEFAAWYLASLIERFDGHLPLAIASYNGGPHNVRRWMESYSPDMPLDAFLEHIPFNQTYRYVRRVLTHYAAYRAQQGLPMEQLDTHLPQLAPDPIGF